MFKFTHYLQKIRNSPFVLQSLNTLIFRVFGVVLLFGFTLFLTNNFSPKIVGQYDFVRSFLLVIGSVCLLGCDQSILYFRGRLKGANSLYVLKGIYKKSVGLLFSMSMIVFLIVFCTNKDLVNTFFSDQGVHLILLKSSGLLFFSALTTLNIEVFRALDHLYVAELFRNTIKHIPLVLGAILLVYIKKEIYLVDAFLIGFVILATITTIIVFNYFSKVKTNSVNEPVTYKEIVIKSYPIAISGMALFLLMSFDIMFLKKYWDDETVAFYSVAVKLMTILSMVIVTVNITVSTKIAEYFSIKNNAALNKIVKNSSRLIFILTFPAVVLICLFSEYILSFFGSDYLAAKEALLILILGQGICSVFGSASVYLNMTGRQHLFQVILVVAVLVNFVLNRLLVPQYGMTGAAAAFVVSSFLWNFISAAIIYYIDKVKVYLN